MDSLSLQVNYDRPVFVKPDREFDCPVCMQTVWQAVQTPCGHRLCDFCFMGLVSETGRALCPVADEECEMLTSNPKNVFRDAYAIREVLKMDVFCKNQVYGCQEVMQCKNLLSHLEECEYTALSCPNSGCPETVARCHLDKHMKEQCGYRLLQCQYCGAKLPASSLQKHLDSDCPEYVVPCPFRCGETEILRRQLAEHMESCPAQPMQCDYVTIGCDFTGSKEDVKDHMTLDVERHLELAVTRLSAFDLEKAELRREVQEKSNENDLLKSQVQSLSSTVTDLNAKCRKLELGLVSQQERVIKVEDLCRSAAAQTDVQQHTQEIVVIREMQEQHEARLQSVESAAASPAARHTTGAAALPESQAKQFQSHERQLAVHDVRLAEIDLRFQVLETVSYNGVLLWKIRDYSRRKRDAVDRKTLSLYSQPFYTSRHGYRLCARVYLNGDGIGKGTHMSLFFVVMRGEYDALLVWPFKQKVTMTLLDQDQHRRHLSDSFRPDPTSSSFRMPTSEMNVASGCPLFAPHSVVESPLYYKNDTIFIKINVDCSGLVDV